MALVLNEAVDGTPIALLKPNSGKRVRIRCDSCTAETTTTYANYMKSRVHRKEGETLCRKCASLVTGAQKAGKPIKKSGPRPQIHASKNASWKGGRFIASDGYVKVYTGPRNYRKEHFLVMEAILGRPLLPTEVVHHKDGDKTNSAGDNLVLLPSESAHRAAHNSLGSLGYSLVRCGLIQYQTQTNTYVAVGKLRELLEQPEVANQQPSEDGDVLEGSTTRRRVSSRQ